MKVLAIDIGGTKFSMALFESGRMTRRDSRGTQREGGRGWMLQQIVSIAQEWRREVPFECCGVGFGGPVDFPLQRSMVSNVVADWQDFPLSAALKADFDVPTVMDNDANAGALGEAVYGAGRGCDPLVYMTISTGVGGGIIIGGHVYRGADSFAGEVGHITVRPDGPACACGARGCLERMCSGIWLEKDHGKSAKELLQNSAFVEQYVVDLARGLKSVLLLLNPARVVIGGGIGKAGDALFEPLKTELRRQIDMNWSRARIDVVPATLGDDSVLWGALALTETELGAR